MALNRRVNNILDRVYNENHVNKILRKRNPHENLKLVTLSNFQKNFHSKERIFFDFTTMFCGIVQS